MLDFFAQNTMFITFVSSLTALAICIVVGYIGRKVNILTDEVNMGLSSLLIKITLPCVIFISMMRPFSRTLLLESLATLFLSGIVYLSGYFIGGWLARLMGAGDSEKKVWQFSFIFANVGYMGFPIIYAIFGYEGMIYTSMANVAFNVLAFTLGVQLYKKDNSGITRANLKSIILSPALVAIYIGFIFFLTGLRLPATVHNGVELIGSMTTPLSMLLVGAILAKSRLLSLVNDFRVLPVIFIRLLAIPLVTFFILRMFVHNHLMLSIIVILAAMPAAAITVIFAEQYKGDTETASKLVALSSLLCLITIPLISLVLS